MFFKPSFESKFIKSSLLSFKELEFIIQGIDLKQIELITQKGKIPFSFQEYNKNTSLIISNALNVKLIFNSFVKVFKEKFPILKNCKRHDVHIYAGASHQSKTFPVHVDTSHTIVLQTEGKCKWLLPEDFEVEMECGDLLWIPKGTKHGCLPQSKRISLSFAFWEN